MPGRGLRRIPNARTPGRRKASSDVSSIDAWFSISEVARLIGVSAATLRAWEREALVDPARSATGYRRYRSDDLRRLREVRQMREIQGLNVPAIRLALRINGRPSNQRATLSADLSQTEMGIRLKSLRQAQHKSVRQAAAQTGLSASFISLIERGLANPSVAALQKLTAGYGTSIAELMGALVNADEKLVRPTTRKILEVTPGVKLEQLSFGNRQMEIHVFTVLPGAGSAQEYQHVGEEFIFMLAGSLEVWLDAVERYVLEVGDLLYFASSQSHRWTNIGEQPAVFLGVNSPSTF
ncbi:MAG: MerR family transcriptional regulator [Chloroflexota bacterium]|nr:MerR family transcriptional regulator [Chloroflexota bacterium]